MARTITSAFGGIGLRPGGVLIVPPIRFEVRTNPGVRTNPSIRKIFVPAPVVFRVRMNMRPGP